MQTKKSCPFKHEECNSDCALYIDPYDLNEGVRNKLASLGVLNREEGLCSLKNQAMCMNRIIYEELSGFMR